ncbi:MAG: hypothetical protein E5299_00877 [Burkholderia gladioli]|nr:MAG: hypothetical protein E5299_00877 [Burkholderia gladioli]
MKQASTTRIGRETLDLGGQRGAEALAPALLHKPSVRTRSDGIISSDTNGLRTSEVRHTVDDADANGDLGRLCESM